MSNTERRITRRNFIVSSASLGATLVLGSCNVRETGVVTGSNYVLRLEYSGIPYDYVVDGRPVNVDRELLVKIWQEAMTSGKRVLVCVSPVEVDLKERKTEILGKLPEDVLTPDELASHGVSIIGNQDTPIKLSIRPSAFDERMPLSGYNQKNQLEVVLVNGPSVNTAYLTTEEADKYGEMLTRIEEEEQLKYYGLSSGVCMVLTKENLADKTKDSLAYYKKGVEAAEYRLDAEKVGYLTPDVVNIRSRGLLYSLVNLELSHQYYSPEEAVMGAGKGRTVNVLARRLKTGDVNRNIVFLAANQDKKPLTFLYLCCDPDGKFRVGSHFDKLINDRVVSIPRPEDSRLTITAFETNAYDGTLLRENRTIGVRLVNTLFLNTLTKDGEVEGFEEVAIKPTVDYFNKANKRHNHGFLVELPTGGYIET